jgi:hypothetical protein
VVIQEFGAALIALGLIAATSMVLKVTWYDHLRTLESVERSNVLRDAATVHADVGAA